LKADYVPIRRKQKDKNRREMKNNRGQEKIEGKTTLK